MEFTVRKAVIGDLKRVEEIYAYARSFMAANGNPNQWGKSHPPVQQLRQDIAQGYLHVILDDAGIHGVFYYRNGEDPTYAEIHDGRWHWDEPYGVIHRIAGDGSGGILKTAVSWARRECQYIRIDTHADNHVMQWALEKLGFCRCGIIHLENGDPRIAYDRMVDI